MTESNLLENLLVGVKIALNEKQRAALVGVLAVDLISKRDEIDGRLP